MHFLFNPVGHRAGALLISLFLAVAMMAACSNHRDESSQGDDDHGDDATADDGEDDAADDASDDSGDDSSDDVADDSADDSGDDSADDSADDAADDSADDDTEPVCVPPAGGTRSPLRAGVAVGDLYAPIGSSMGGFGARPGPAHPYAVTMGASTGSIGRPNVKAVSLDNGESRVVIARVAAAGVTEVVYRKTLARVCEISGVDLNGRLWISATHTHSGPTHFFPIPPILGGAGMDVYDETFANRFADSIAQAVKDSMDNLEPAAVDATVETSVDPGNLWSADRRCQNDPPSYKEDRLFLARIDRADGSPLAALVSMAIHGVYMGTTLMTGDVPGAVENGLQNTFGEPVEVLFLQGPAGDVNPVGAPNPLNDEQSLEWYSQSLGPVLRSVYDDLSPQTDTVLAMATKPQPISRDLIGYADGEFGWYNDADPPVFHPYENGAFYCGSGDVLNDIDFFRDHGSILDCGDLSTTLVDGYYGCALPLLWIDAWWMWALNPTEIADIRIGDYLLSLIPGELTSFLSKRLREQLAAQTGVPDSHIATFGYSNAYQLYLLTEWDWMQGGYETSMNLWGPKFGDFLVDRNVELAKTLYAAQPPEVLPEPPVPAMPWPKLLPDGFERALSVGATVEHVRASYERFETVSFSWNGGFTGVDPHRVYFETETLDGFVNAMLPDGRPLTDAGIQTVVTYQASPDYSAVRFPAQRTHRYNISWELTADVPAGRYRIRVEGSTWNGSSVSNYTAVSDVFEVEPSSALSVRNLSVQDQGGGAYLISCDAFWPPNPAGRRLRRLGWGMNDWSPVTGGAAVVTIFLESGPEIAVTLTGGSSGHYEGVYNAPDPSLARTARIEAGGLIDTYGNTDGTSTEPVPFP